MSPAEKVLLRALLLAVCVALPASATAQSKKEEQRRALQERLGIKKPATQAASPDAGTAAPETAGPTGEEDEETAPADPSTGTAATRAAPRPRVPTFFGDALPVLTQRCASCHSPSGSAKRSRWVLRGDPEDYTSTLRTLKLATPAKSPLLTKGSGQSMHGAGKVIDPKSTDYATLLAWIEGGAKAGTPRATTVAEPEQAPKPGEAAGAATKQRTTQGGSPSATDPGTASTTPPPGGSASASEQAPRSGEAAAVDTGVSFAPRLHEALLTSCGSCHSADGMAASTGYVTDADPAAHLAAVRALVVPGEPSQSVLHERARGEGHGAGEVWADGSEELALLAQWIREGAGAAAAPGADPAVAGTPSQPSPSQPSPASPPAAPARPPGVATGGPPGSPHGGPPGHRGGISLGTHPLIGSLQLNGRFDLNFERRGYNDHPFKPEAVNALRSYHQFLFLTRQSAEDPISITLELLSLQLWEIGLRISNDRWPVKVSAKLGKLLVPFGAEPLFHHSYGGLAGFDQKVLPPVFAREGISANVQKRLGEVALSADVYLISGYALKRADGLLNLQADFAPNDEVRLGGGARLGASWGPISAWYSPYFNTLGFGRRLFMQALDVMIWRPRQIPVLGKFSLGAGLMRADVSGGADEGFGGPGADYYHFANYLQLRYYPLDWLYLQYRQGVRTFGNKRGVYLDTTDLTREDGSSHNVGAVARWRGLSVGLFHFWNLEKADEVPDDFTRLVVAYDF